MAILSWIFRFLAYIGFTILLLMLIAWLTGYGYLIRGVRYSYLKGYTSANIYDGNDFDTRKVATGTKVSELPRSADYNRVPMPAALSEMLKKTNSTSFLVLRNDSIVWEYYYNAHSDTTRSNSFSMAKSITTILVQQAIEDKLIPGWDTRVKQYLPWLEGAYADKLTLKHLSTMTAGLNWPESYYNPFGITARAYYGSDIEATMKKVKVVSEPGVEYDYQSGATQLLGLCLQKALKRPIADYASEKIWLPLGAEMNASWHTDDKDGTELTYCCFNATTRDFARFGKMLLHQGKSESGPLVDSAFLAFATKPYKANFYGQSFWIGATQGRQFYRMQGTLGQFIMVLPGQNMVIVRTGNSMMGSENGTPRCVQTYADESVKTLFKAPDVTISAKNKGSNP